MKELVPRFRVLASGRAPNVSYGQAPGVLFTGLGYRGLGFRGVGLKAEGQVGKRASPCLVRSPNFTALGRCRSTYARHPKP